MFENVTKRDAGRRTARNGAFLLGAAALQTLLVAVAIVVSARLAKKADGLPAVDVRFFPQSAAPAPAPPTPPAAAMKSALRSGPKRVRAEKPAVRAAIVTPRDTPAPAERPAPVENREPYDGSSEGSETGVLGGAEGGVVGGVPGGTGSGPGDGPGVDEAPRYAGSGYRRPSEADPGCLGRTIRIPSELRGFTIGSITVKFAVGRDGSAGLVEIMSRVPDARIAEIIRTSIQKCTWKPGTDAQGRPVRLWVVLPIRFTNE